MPTFDELIQNIHGGNGVKQIVRDDDFNISINPNNRILEAQSGFNNIIGVTSDYNAEEIIFKSPKVIEGHSVFDCSNKTIKWENQASGMKGSEALVVAADTADDTSFLLKWIIPPSALTQAGQLHIAISFCDKEDEVILYKWNSQIYTQLTIVQGMDSIASAHSLSKPLTIDVYTREIYIPNGFDTIIGYTGDSGLNTITFRINRYYQNIDLSKGTIKLHWINANNDIGEYPITEFVHIESLSSNEIDDVLEFHWKISNQLLYKAGNIQIFCSITVEQEQGLISWASKALSTLKVAEGTRTSEITIDTVDYSLPVVDRDVLAALLKNYYDYEIKEEE